MHTKLQWELVWSWFRISWVVGMVRCECGRDRRYETCVPDRCALDGTEHGERHDRLTTTYLSLRRSRSRFCAMRELRANLVSLNVERAAHAAAEWTPCERIQAVWRNDRIELRGPQARHAFDDALFSRDLTATNHLRRSTRHHPRHWLPGSNISPSL